MSQIVPKLLVRGLDRKQILIAAAIAVVGVGTWQLLRDSPRTVQETTWDRVVFPEIAEAPVLARPRRTDSDPTKPARVLETPVDAGSGGMRVEMAANVPLHLDNDLQHLPVRDVQFDENSRLPEPTWLEGGIETVGETVY